MGGSHPVGPLTPLAANQDPAGGGGRPPGPAQPARTADYSPARQAGGRRGGPRNRANYHPANYQPAGSGLAPRAHRPPTRITAVSPPQPTYRPPRWTKTHVKGRPSRPRQGRSPKR